MAGVPTLQQVQQWVKTQKRRMAGHTRIEDVKDLKDWAADKLIPAIAYKVEDLLEDVTYVVPEQTPNYEVDGVCITCRAEIDWLIQVVRSGVKWVLHIDGKHKLHHGKFIFITYGTHSLELDVNTGKVRGCDLNKL